MVVVALVVVAILSLSLFLKDHFPLGDIVSFFLSQVSTTYLRVLRIMGDWKRSIQEVFLFFCDGRTSSELSLREYHPPVSMCYVLSAGSRR